VRNLASIFYSVHFKALRFRKRAIYPMRWECQWLPCLISKFDLGDRSPNSDNGRSKTDPENRLPYPPLDNIWVMVIVWRLKGNIIRTALYVLGCVTQCSQSAAYNTYMSSSYKSSRLGLSHWDPYTMHRGGCLELYYCNMVEWSWWDSSLIWKTNWFPSVLWHRWFGHMTCKNRPRYDL